MGGKPAFEIPDYKIYNVQGVKSLEWTRDELAKKGLKDPWLRNEVWKYQNFTSYRSGLMNTAFRGFKWAVAAVIVTIAVDKAFGISSKDDHNEEGHH